MPRISDDSLRAALRHRAAGTPSRGLRARIRRALRESQDRVAVNAIPRPSRPRAMLGSLAASSAIAAVLVFAPVADALFDVWQRLYGQTGPQAGEELAPELAVTVSDGDEDDEDGEGGDDEDDDGAEDDEDDEDGEDAADDEDDDEDEINDHE